MNREQIMTLTPDELRLAIAKAKGVELHYPFNGKYGPYMVDGRNSDGEPYFCTLTRWSTSIADAWELVEEMRPSFFQIHVLCWDHSDNWICQCDERHGHDENVAPIYGNGNTAPLAISRAYLMWKDGEE